MTEQSGASDKSPQLPGHSEEQLKRALIRLSIAADSLDPQLDQQLTELRSALRSDNSEERFGELLPALERSVLAMDDKRRNQQQQVANALRKLLGTLERPAPPLDEQLSALKKSLPEAAEHSGKLLGATLRSLELFLSAGQTAGHHAGSRPRGLFSRLLRREQPADESATQTETLTQPEPESTDTGGSMLSGEEQGYSQVAAHVESILLNLLDQLQLGEQAQGRSDQLRARLMGGLNWYELAVFLEELSQLILVSQNNRQDDFQQYLKQLNQRLAQFQSSLGDTHDAYLKSSQFEEHFEGMLRDQVAGLHADVREAVDLEDLKHTVENKLERLISEVDNSRQQRQQHEREVADKLQGMVERMRVMEVEAQSFRQHLDEQQRRAMLDNLTGLANRAGLEKRMQEEYERWQRYGGQLLLVVMDVDHFKQINDSFGHLAGDKVLRLIAQQLSRRLRKSDFIGRFGGEEFVALMPGTAPEQGRLVLEQIRQGIQDSPFHYKNQPVPVTISIGYSALRSGDSLESLFERADQAMYQAKQQGRNRVVEGA